MAEAGAVVCTELSHICYCPSASSGTGTDSVIKRKRKNWSILETVENYYEAAEGRSRPLKQYTISVHSKSPENAKVENNIFTEN